MRRRDNGLWGMPRGLVEVGETLSGAAARELWEETGLAGQATRLLLVSDTHHDGGSTLHVVSATFLVEADGDPQSTLEASEVGWFTPDNWPPLNDGHAVRLAKALSALEMGETLFDIDTAPTHLSQKRSQTGRTPASSLLVRVARQLLRAVFFGEIGRIKRF